MKRIFAILAVLILGSQSAQAGIMIEPYLGYVVGGEIDDGGGATADPAGTLFGARLGFRTLGFMAGVDYQTGTIEAQDWTDNAEDSDSDVTDLGVFVGYEFPILFRVYFSYFFDSKSEPEGSTGELEGSGTRLGVGYTGLPFVAINLELLSHSYDEFDGSALSSDFTADSYVLSVSLPLP